MRDFSYLGHTITIENNCICPYCHKGVSNIVQNVAPAGEDGSIYLLVICPLCGNSYFVKNYLSNPKERIYAYRGSFPAHIEIDLPIYVLTKYPEFAHIYSQCLVAQKNGLESVAGMGFRKAIEFLVKPYVKSLFPDQASVIDNEPLSITISRIQYPLITRLAKAATWLGNDQTHIQQWHINYDVEDLKRFIKSLCLIIEAEHTANEETKGVLSNPKNDV